MEYSQKLILIYLKFVELLNKIIIKEIFGIINTISPEQMIKNKEKKFIINFIILQNIENKFILNIIFIQNIWKTNLI